MRVDAFGLVVGRVEQVGLAGRGLREEEVAEVGEDLVRHVAEVLPLLDQAVHELEHALGVADGHGVAERVLHVGATGPDERGDDVLVDRGAAENRCLIQERERVAERPLGLPGHRVCGRLGEGDALLLRDADEVLGDDVHPAAAEVEPLAPPDDGRRHLVRLGRREDEPNAHRRLLEHLQQRVERLAREALRLVDDVDLLAALDRRGRRLLAEVARVLDAAVRGRVDLDHVEVLSLADPKALIAGSARLGRRALLAVDHLGQDPGGRGLAGSPRATEQERVGEPALANRAHQRADHVLLPQDLAGTLRPVLPIQGLVRLILCHAHPSILCSAREGKRAGRTKCSGDRAPAVDHAGLERVTGR